VLRNYYHCSIVHTDRGNRRITMSKNKTPLHEALRPNCHPDQAGDVGQSLFSLAEWFEENRPSLEIDADFTEKALVDAALNATPTDLKQNHSLAIKRLLENARQP